MELASAVTDGTLGDFVKAVEENPEKDWRSFLFWVFKNKDLRARVEIVNWMLDHGADPARINRHEGTNALRGKLGCCSVFWMGVRILI